MDEDEPCSLPRTLPNDASFFFSGSAQFLLIGQRHARSQGDYREGMPIPWLSCRYGRVEFLIPVEPWQGCVEWNGSPIRRSG
jgi:hypothetical protein